MFSELVILSENALSIASPSQLLIRSKSQLKELFNPKAQDKAYTSVLS